MTENDQVQRYDVSVPNAIQPRPVEDILNDVKTIDLKKISNEILQWTCDNVENFIDNQNKMFKIDFTINSTDMPETKKLQDLYGAVPEDHQEDTTEAPLNTMIDIMNCRAELNKITDLVFNDIVSNQEMLDKLYKKMIFYYEMVGLKNGVPIIRELEGKVTIDKFEYEAFTVPVKLSRPEVRNEEGDLITEAQTVREYVIPEGFTLWLTIHFQDVKKPTSIF